MKNTHECKYGTIRMDFFHISKILVAIIVVKIKSMFKIFLRTFFLSFFFFSNLVNAQKKQE